MSPRAVFACWSIIIALTIALLGFAGYGVYSAWHQVSVPKPEVVTAKPMEVQRDGSVIAERRPMEQQDLDPIPHTIPKGAIEERRGHVTVKPRPVSSNGKSPPESFVSVGIDYSLVREQDGGRRMVVSSQDGQVLDAVDIPIEAALLPAEPRRWSAGVAYRPDGGYGAIVTRDVGPVRLGGMVLKPPGRAAEAWLMAGWTF